MRRLPAMAAVLSPGALTASWGALDWHWPNLQWRIGGRQVRTLALMAVLMAALVWVTNNEMFYVYSAEIRGNTRIPSENLYLASGIDTVSIFWIQPAAIEKRLAALPGIASAKVHVRLPNQVIIDVQESAPYLIWNKGAGNVWVGQNGSVMPPADTTPALRLIDPDGAAAGPNGALRPQVVAQVIALRALRPEVTNLYYGRNEGLYFLAPEGWSVYLGEDGNMTEKLAALATLQSQLKGAATAPKSIDLRTNGKVFLKGAER
jgi:cell division septal protein FtsQ